jgi:Fe2+ transport system protein FeoA
MTEACTSCGSMRDRWHPSITSVAAGQVRPLSGSDQCHRHEHPQVLDLLQLIRNKLLSFRALAQGTAPRRAARDGSSIRGSYMTSSDCAAQRISLSTLSAGKQGIVHSLSGGHEFCSRVANLGFTPGAPVKVLQNPGHGPVLVSVRGTMVALGRAEAAKVVLREVGDDQRLP